MTALQKGIVKQITSGDTLIIRGQPKNGPPPEKRLRLANVTAPKIARKETPNIPGCEDEPYAWESREFLRKKLVGREISFVVEYKVNTRDQEFGSVYLGKDANSENIAEIMISEGLVTVQRTPAKANDEMQIKYIVLEEAAKVSKKGIWSDDSPNDHIRKITWEIENPRNLVDSFKNKPVDAVIEHVRDGSTVRAFLLPNFQYITLMLSGMKCPMISRDDAEPAPYAAEAKFYVESRLLQREVQIILEGVSNQNIIGTIIHPNGNISELLLKDGFAKCVDWSMGIVTTGVDKLRAAEKFAKEKRIRLWKDYTPSTSGIAIENKEYVAKVSEIVNGDCMMVVGPDNKAKKIFLSSMKPPRLPADAQPLDNKRIRPLYDIPYMFEAREFLRKKLVGKKVNVSVDYIQPASQGYPEKTCCTVTASGVNVAEALISKGLATVIRHRQDDDQRSAHYDILLAAESQAQKKNAGQHSKKDPVIHRVADLSGDVAKSKQFLPFLTRAGRSEAVVEFIASGSRLRLYITKENCLITFLLAGIECPRGARPIPGGSMSEAEEYGDEALALTKERCLQRDVYVEVESQDRRGNFIGWLFVDGVNQSVTLVEEGLAKVHFTAERSNHYRALTSAEERAKNAKLNLWSKYVEPKEEDQVKDDVLERKVEHKKVVVTEICEDSSFYVQSVDTGAQLESLMEKLRLDLDSTPPLPGSYTPHKGEMCAAKFTDGLWYRAKIEKVDGKRVSVFYMDFGNREIVNQSLLASLSAAYQSLPGQAQQYQLACTALPQDEDYKDESLEALRNYLLDRQFLSNVEYKSGNTSFVTLLTPGESQDDIGQTLISDGYLLAESRREKRLQSLVSEYSRAQDKAKKAHLHVWQYGDFRAEEAREFGYQK